MRRDRWTARLMRWLGWRMEDKPGGLLELLIALDELKKMTEDLARDADRAACGLDNSKM